MHRLSELMRRVNSSSETEQLLEEIVHGVVDLLGYGVAAIARLEGDTLVMTNVAGPPEVRDQILGRRTPAEQILDEFREADHWGILRFVPAGRMSEARRRAAWIPDLEPSEDPDAWHPENALYAPLYSATGELLGNMAVDLPPGGKVPPTTERELLEMFVVQAGLALSNARERERLTEQVRLGEMVKKVAMAGTLGGLDAILQASVVAIGEGLDTIQAWVRCFPDEGRGPEVGAGHPRDLAPDEDIPGLRRDLTIDGTVTEPQILGVNDASSPVLVASRKFLQGVTRWARGERAVVCPITSGGHLLGYAVLLFAGGRPGLNHAEQMAIAEVGRELGRIVHQARVLETEQRLVEELRALARYRSELIATISHELKTPLTAIMGHAELISDLHPDVGSIDAISRNAQRLNRLVGNLLEYSRVQGRRESVRRAVDVSELAGTSVDLLRIKADQGEIGIDLAVPDEPVVVFGDPDELARVIDNLVDNAIKYSSAGSHVEVSVSTTTDEVVVQVCDTGMGISDFDRSQLFSAFHRSTNPDALSVPGTGLGLAISRRIVTSHGGRIEVDSEIGKGSTFRLVLPLRS
jgi:signal transduction histidine kinase